jgi:extracellular elastinolytic metalloproteinase
MADWNEKAFSTVPDYVLGQYEIDDPAGIRSHRLLRQSEF